MGWINRIRNVFGMGDSQDPGHRPASTHSRAEADAGQARTRRKASGGHAHHGPLRATPTSTMAPADLRESAIGHFRLKHWEQALAFFRRLLEVAPDHGDDPRLGLVVCLLNLGRVAEARPYFTAADAPANLRLEAAHYFLAHLDYAQALPLWRTLAAEPDAAELHAPAWRMRCLLELGQTREARFLYEAPDANLEELGVAGNFLQQNSRWEEALNLWQRFDRGAPDEQAEGLAGRVRCLLELDRAAEAAALYTPAAAAPAGRLAAAEYFDEHENYTAALPLYRQVAAEGAATAHHPAARRGEMLCLLQLGEEAAAAKLLAAPDLPIEALRAAAIFHHEAERWEEALAIDRRIAKTSDEDRPAAEGFQVACLLHLGRDAEARKLYNHHEARPQCRRAAADFFAAQNRFAEALPLWEGLVELPDFHTLALKNQVYCLLQLDREAAAEKLYAADPPPLPALLGAANFFFNAERYDRALPLWQRVAAGAPGLAASVSGKIVHCLLELSREADARALYEAADAPAEAVQAAAEFWMFPAEGAPGAPSEIRTPATYREALGLWRRRLTGPGEAPISARRGELGCLLALEQFDEAMPRVHAAGAHPTLLLDATLFFCLSQRWDRALPLLDEVIARDAELTDRSLAFKVTGLLSLDRHAEAAKLYDAADAPLAVILAAAEFFREHGQWDTALSLYRRVTVDNSDGEPAGIAHQVDCLLWLGRDAEAKALYGGAHPPRQALVSAGNFFIDTRRWADALTVWQKLDRSDVPFRAQAQAHLVGALLRLGRREEAEALYLPADALPEALFAAWSVLAYLQDWTAALSLAEQRLAAPRHAVRQAAHNYRLRCLIRLQRLAEARPLYSAEDLPAANLNTAGYDLMRTRQWAEALAVWQTVGRRFPQQHHYAPAQEAYCLLALGRAAEARAIYEPAAAAPAILTAVASFFDAQRDYAAAGDLHRRLIAAQPGPNPLLGYFKNRIADGDWATVTGDLSARLHAELDPLVRRHDLNAYRQALWLPLAQGRFSEALAKALEVERRLTGIWRLVRCYELQLIAGALAGARKPFERALQQYRETGEGLDDSVTLPDVVRQLALRYGVKIEPQIQAQLDTLLTTP